MRPAVLIGLALAVLPAFARADDVDAAIEVLNTRNIPFNKEQFLDVVRLDDEDNVKTFLQAGMDPNTADDAGTPALILAAERGWADVIKDLATGHVALNAKNARGWTALLMAVLLQHDDAAQALLDAGADPNVGDNYGVTPLMLAVQARRIPLVEALLVRKADARQQGSSGQTAVTIAVVLDDGPLLKVFEKAGLGPEVKRARKELTELEKREKIEERERARAREAKRKAQMEAVGR